MANGEVVNDYGALARYYDLAYDAGLGDRILEIAVLRSLVDGYCPDAKSLLDLGTGTGTILGAFKGHITYLVGIDTAPEMLSIAQRGVPEADFLEADMADFELGTKFDVVLCLFNAINHLKGIDQWKSLFRKTAHHLNPGGILIFDMMTVGSMRELAADAEPNSWSIEGGSYSLEVTKSESGENDYTTTFTIQLDEDGSPQMITGNLHQTVYPVDEVKTLAAEYFEPVLDFDLTRDLLKDGRFRRVTDASSRPVFVYQSPKT